MPVCAILTCNASTEGPDGPPKGLAFHPFPKECVNKLKWIEMTGRNDWQPNESDAICGKHFRESDFCRKRSGLKYLKSTAIPCEYVVYRGIVEDEFVHWATPPPKDPPPPPAPPAPPATPLADLAASIIVGDTQSDDDNDMNDNSIGWDQFQATFDPDPENGLVHLSTPLQQIKRIVSKRNEVCRKAMLATMDEVNEAKKIQFLLKGGLLDNLEKANGIIELQSKKIVTLNIKNKRLNKILKQVADVLAGVELDVLLDVYHKTHDDHMQIEV